MGGEVKQPHPYLLCWLGCRKHSTDHNKLLPNDGGWLDQPAEMMLAFELCDDLFAQEKKVQEQFNRQTAERQKVRENLLRP